MGKRLPIKTDIKEAVEYWSARIDECGLSIDWAEGSTHCWRCGCEKNLERCHIIPDSLGGKDEASNIVLLCKRCHIDGPNVTDPEIMWDWIRSYGVAFYESFWNIMGMKEYEFIYHSSVQKDIKAIFDSAQILPKDQDFEKVRMYLHESAECAIVHFGHPYLNNATMAGIYRMAIKKLAEHYDVTFPLEEAQEQTYTSWWTKYYFETL